MASIDPVLHKAKTDKQPKVKDGMMEKLRQVRESHESFHHL